MKLVHQINLAFALSLILVLSVTAVVIHYVLMDHFIGTQRKDMQTIGAELTAKLETAAAQSIPIESAPLAVSGLTSAQVMEVGVIIQDNEGNVVSSSPVTPSAQSMVSQAIRPDFVASYSSAREWSIPHRGDGGSSRDDDTDHSDQQD